ncbi:MAG: calcium-binding protein [Candidatus Dojkabacteria bacterium]|nr:calcium-binding protein [Candidatus Dojkabacteria bacterium]
MNENNNTLKLIIIFIIIVVVSTGTFFLFTSDEEKKDEDVNTSTADQIDELNDNTTISEIISQPEIAVPEDNTLGETPTTKYKDGTYTSTGKYNSPAGSESITVTLSLENDKIESLNVKSNTKHSKSKIYEGLFIDGINYVVVGKNIDEADVSKVNGSSLTSGGFNQAINQIINEDII